MKEFFLIVILTCFYVVTFGQENIQLSEYPKGAIGVVEFGVIESEQLNINLHTCPSKKCYFNDVQISDNPDSLETVDFVYHDNGSNFSGGTFEAICLEKKGKWARVYFNQEKIYWIKIIGKQLKYLSWDTIDNDSYEGWNSNMYLKNIQ